MTVFLRGACALGALAFTSILSAQTKPDASQVAYGKYITEDVARCQDCHTPRLETGEYDKSKWMKGATLDFGPLKPIEKWHKTSPDLTPSGKLWERWGEDGLRKFMKTALNPRGGHADVPMPPYKYQDKEADAVVAYLKTLK